MTKLTVTRSIITPELAAKHYPGIEYKIIKEASQEQIRAAAVRKATVAPLRHKAGLGKI